MEEKGLVRSLEQHHNRLYHSLWDFHSYAKSIVEHTKSWRDNLKKSTELGDQEHERIMKEETYVTLSGLTVVVSNLFRAGSRLKKPLEKIV